jgi:hypothetical protein
MNHRIPRVLVVHDVGAHGEEDHGEVHQEEGVVVVAAAAAAVHDEEVRGGEAFDEEGLDLASRKDSKLCQ